MFTGLALGGSLAAGALLGSAITKRFAPDMPIIGGQFRKGEKPSNNIGLQTQGSFIGKP